MTPLDRVAVASRIFAVAAITGLGLLAQDSQLIVGIVMVSAVAITATYVSLATPLPPALVVTVEACVTGLVIGLALPGGVIFLPYLVVLTLVAGTTRGIVGVSAVVIVQFFSIAAVTFSWAPGGDREELLQVLSPWLLTSIGMGLLGAWLRTGKNVRPGSDAPYEAAHRLLTQLRTVARRLSSGLDLVTIATQIQEDISAATAAADVSVFVHTHDEITPLLYSSEAARDQLSTRDPVLGRCWAVKQPVVGGGHTAAFPLRVGSRMVGISLVRLSVPLPAEKLDALMKRLNEHSLRLDTALTFDEIRSIATVEERRRLAREIHDGVAQELASLGYQVDDVIAGSESELQQRALTALRLELTRVVSELRLSIYDLRSAVLSETGLSVALSEYVRQVGMRSAMTVHLSLAGEGARLRAETEAELLRIVQEAITNARKHSRADNLWVECRVHPPFALLEVRDDGVGPRGGRSDSFGLAIMKERALRLGANLEIGPATDNQEMPGTLIRITLGDWSRASPEPESEATDDDNCTDQRLTRGRS